MQGKLWENENSTNSQHGNVLSTDDLLNQNNL